MDRCARAATMSGDDEASFVNFIIALRGGYPANCDFCLQPFTKDRRPIPEEAGEWACTECVARWYGRENQNERGGK